MSRRRIEARNVFALEQNKYNDMIGKVDTTYKVISVISLSFIVFSLMSLVFIYRDTGRQK